MRKIVFENITIKNFLSVGKKELFIDYKVGTNLITGENKDQGGRNGVGKSTLIEAPYWCLFGNTIRDLKTDEIIHDQSKGDCSVILNFTVDDGKYKTPYTLTRSLKPTKVTLESHLDQRTVDLTLSTIPKTDEYIRELIGASEQVFQNAVIMTVNNTTPFMQQKKIDKRKFVEGILDLSIFGEMLLKIRAEYNDKKKENDLLAKDYSNELRILEMMISNKENFDDSKQNRIKLIVDKLEIIEEDISRLQKVVLPDVNDSKSELTRLRKKLQDLEDVKKDLNDEISEATSSKRSAEYIITQKESDKKKLSNKPTSCPTCKRKFEPDGAEDHIKNEIEKLDNEIRLQRDAVAQANKIIIEKNALLKKISTGEEAIEENIDTIKESISSVALHEQRLFSLNEKKSEYERDIKSIESETFKDDKGIEDSSKKIKELESEIESMQKTLLILENSKFIVSEEGVKTLIVKKMLSSLNSILNYYLKTLDAPCSCEFNDMFEETIYNKQGKECSYFNFSGGERRRIDIAILFMFQDMLRMQTGIAFNLNVFDELLDSALDEKGIHKILELLRERTQKYNEAIYIVSHNKSAANSGFDNTLLLEKKDGVTSIV